MNKGEEKIDHFRQLNDYRELLNHAKEVNNPHLHVMHKNPIK